MRYRRRTFLLGATALAALPLGGCRGPTLFGPPPTVQPPAPPARVGLVYDDRSTLTTMMKEAQQTPVRQAVEAVAAAGRVPIDREVTLIPVDQTQHAESLDALVTALLGKAGEAPPDLLVFTNYEFPDFGLLRYDPNVMDLLRPLDDLVAASSTAVQRDYYPGALAYCSWNGRLYALPLVMGVGIVMYDPTLFQQAGVELPDATWDWQHMLNASLRLTRRPGQYAWATLPDLSVFLWQNGADILSPDGQRCILDQPAAIEAATFYGDLFTRYKVVAPSVSGFPIQGGQITAGGVRAAMNFASIGSYTLPAPLQAVEPFHGTVPATTIFVSQALTMAARTPDPRQAYAAMVALATELQRRYNSPPRRSLAAQPAPSPVPTPVAELSLTEGRAAEYGRTLWAAWDFTGPYNQSLVQPLQQGTVTADAACRKATQEINAELQRRAGTPGSG